MASRGVLVFKQPFNCLSMIRPAFSYYRSLPCLTFSHCESPEWLFCAVHSSAPKLKSRSPGKWRVSFEKGKKDTQSGLKKNNCRRNKSCIANYFGTSHAMNSQPPFYCSTWKSFQKAWGPSYQRRMLGNVIYHSVLFAAHSWHIFTYIVSGINPADALAKKCSC